MAVDNPGSGQICGRCIKAFDSFRQFAPGVSLKAVAAKNAYFDGRVVEGDGFLGKL